MAELGRDRANEAQERAACSVCLCDCVGCFRDQRREAHVAALAETYYVAVAPRHNGGPVSTAAAIQLAASIPNFLIQHVPLPAAEQDRALLCEIGVLKMD